MSVLIRFCVFAVVCGLVANDLSAQTVADNFTPLGMAAGVNLVGDTALFNRQRAQCFTTDSTHLELVDVHLDLGTTNVSLADFSVELWNGADVVLPGAGGTFQAPTTATGTVLTTTATQSSDDVIFTSPSGTNLAANTIYCIVATQAPGTGTVPWSATAATDPAPDYDLTSRSAFTSLSGGVTSWAPAQRLQEIQINAVPEPSSSVGLLGVLFFMAFVRPKSKSRK